MPDLEKSALNKYEPSPIQDFNSTITADSFIKSPVQYHTHDGIDSPLIAGYNFDINGSGTKTATFVIGPSSNDDSSSYDYVTDGTADEVEIQAAIDALPSNGGRIVFREGTYTLAATVTIAKNGVTLQGQGAGSIITSGVTDLVLFTLGDASTQYYNTHFFNLKITKTGSGSSSRIIKNTLTKRIGDVIIQNCVLGNTIGSIVESNTTANIAGLTIDRCYIDSTSASAMLLLDSALGVGNHVTNCQIYTTTSPIFDGTWTAINDNQILLNSNYASTCISNSQGLVNNNQINISGNPTSGCVVIADAEMVVGNYITCGSSANAASTAIKDCDQVVGNAVSTFGVCVSGAQVVSGNTLFGKAGLITGSQYISGNQLSGSMSANNTYPAILLSSSQHIVTNNSIRTTSGTFSYGIRENDSTSDSIIVGNRVESASCGTATISTQDADSVVAHNLTK